MSARTRWSRDRTARYPHNVPDTVRIDRRLRPLRLLFVVPRRDRAAALDAIEVATCMWGGLFCGIAEATTADGSTGDPHLASYVEAFEPDYVVRMHKDVPTRIAGVDPNRVVERRYVFEEGFAHGAGVMLGLSTMLIMRYLAGGELRFVPSRPRAALIVNPPAADCQLLTAANFGRYPDTFSYVDVFKSTFGAVERDSLGPSDLFDAVVRARTPLKLTSFDLRGLRPLNTVTILEVDSASVSDILLFWNLRALRGPDAQTVALTASDIPAFLEQLAPTGRRVRVFSRAPRHLSKRLSAANLKGLTLEILGLSVLRKSPLPPRTEVRAEADGAGHIANLELGDRVYVPALCPSFARELSVAHGWANVLRISSASWPRCDIATAMPRKIENLGCAIDTSHPMHTALSSEGIVYLAGWAGESFSFRLPDGATVFQAWANERGMSAATSDAGIVTSKVLRALGLPANAVVLADYELLKLIEETNRSGNAKSHKEWRGIIARKLGNATAVQHRLDLLASLKILRIGLKLQCTSCRRINWFSLAELNEALACVRCLASFPFPSTSPPRDDAWCYRTLGPFSVPDYAQGALVVALAIRFFSLLNMHRFTWWPGTEIKVDRTVCEVDFGAWCQEFFSDAEPALVVGECKAHGEFGREAISKLGSVGTRLGAAVVFATLKEELDRKDLPAIRRLAREGRRENKVGGWRCPVIVLTRRELTAVHWPPPTEPGPWDAIHATEGPHLGIKGVALATQNLYLGLEIPRE